ncbi:MAG: serine protease [Prevotella sp.]|nr:serine protease [Prevotella sp.]
MKRLLLVLPLYLFTLLPLSAQSWASKAIKSLLTVKTFSADGSLLASSTGFFIGTDGEAVSSYAPFKGALRAVVIDAQGKEYPVEFMLGANETYDVAKFQVAARKTTPLAIAANATNGSSVWLLPYAVKKTPECVQGTVSSAEQFQEKYQYYTLSMTVEESQVSCPVLNQNGEVVGIIQPSAGDKKGTSYAISARYAADLKISGLSVNDPVMKQTQIPIALPDDTKEALLSLFLASSSMSESQYANMVERFIQKFPNEADGYIYRARYQTSKGNFSSAEEDMQQAVRIGGAQDDVHYQYAELIYQKALYQSDKPFSAWTLDKAFSESQEAYRINPMSVYLQQQAQIRYAQRQYAEAYNLYDQLTRSDLRSADIFFAASQCKAQLNEPEQQLALLDSAVNQFSRPYVKTAAPYLFARAQALYNHEKYRPAVNDYNEYAELMGSQLGAPFYYQRELAELGGHLYQQALNDINKAIELDPTESMYYAEKASLQVRVGMHKDAIETARQLIQMSPDLSDGYLFLGLGQCLTNQKAEGVKNLNKAKEMGNEQAQSLIEKYAK